MNWTVLDDDKTPLRAFGPVLVAYRFLLLRVAECAPALAVPMALRCADDPEPWLAPIDDWLVNEFRADDFPAMRPNSRGWKQAVRQGIADARAFVMTPEGMAEQQVMAVARGLA